MGEELNQVLGQVVPPSAEAMEAFVAKWRPRLQYRGFSQVWVDRVTGQAVDFAHIADLGELERASDRAERQYLAEIEAGVQAYVAKAAAEGWDRQEAELKARRMVCQRELYFLAKVVLHYDKLRFHLHYFMAETMRDLPPGYRGLREMARDSFKTTVLGISWCIQQVLVNPQVSILYKSNAEGNAKSKVAQMRSHFLYNQDLRRLFPEHATLRKSDEGNEGKWTSPCARTRPQQEGTLNAAGVGTGKTSQHYDVIVGDDFWDEKSVTSAEKSLATTNDMAALEYLLTEPATGRIVYIGTRFAHDDPTSTLVGNPEYHCVIVSGILACGRSIFPESLPLAKMMSQALYSYMFSCQVILAPTTDDQQLPRPGMGLRWADMRQLELEGLLAVRKIMVTDAAGSKSATSDEAAILTVAIDHLGRKLVIGSRCGKMSPSEFLDVLFEEFDRWLPDNIVVQAASIDTVMVSFIEQRNAERRLAGKRAALLKRYSLKNEEKKRRITGSLQPLLAAGELFVDPDLADAVRLETEFSEHPNSQNDHRLDALAALGDDKIRMAPKGPERRPEREPAPLLDRRQAKMLELKREQNRDQAAEWKRQQLEAAEEGNGTEGTYGTEEMYGRRRNAA
jgi:hypothetical protein